MTTRHRSSSETSVRTSLKGRGDNEVGKGATQDQVNRAGNTQDKIDGNKDTIQDQVNRAGDIEMKEPGT